MTQDQIVAQLAEINQKLDAILSLLANGVSSRPSAGDACAICGLAYSVHSEAFGMKPGLSRVGVFRGERFRTRHRDSIVEALRRDGQIGALTISDFGHGQSEG